MDIKVGEYIRINNDNRNCIGVGKVTKIFNDVIYLDMNNKYDLPVSFKIENIIKHSKNIIDLIEVGDIVNNGYIYEVGKTKDEHKWVHSLNGLLLFENDIKTILTHEQMEENQYVVKRNMETN